MGFDRAVEQLLVGELREQMKSSSTVFFASLITPTYGQILPFSFWLRQSIPHLEYLIKHCF
jgi:hypothetical protein